MTEQTNETATQQQAVVTQQVVTTKFNTELTKLKFQDALNRFNIWEVTPENVVATQEKIKNVRAFIRKLGDIKTDGKAPALAECRYWDNAYNDVLTPLQTSLTAKEKQLQTVVDLIAQENRIKEIERLRVEGIKKEIDTFLLQTSQQIAAATTAPQLVSIEKLIGSHKSNKSRYQEFLPELIERSNELTPLIKKQKEFIKELEELDRQKKLAEKEQDDRKLLEIQEQQAQVQQNIEEKKIQVQEEAIRQAIAPDAVQTVQPQQQDIKYRRQSWKWKVKDLEALYKNKNTRHLVTLSANEEKIDELMKTKKSDGSLKDVDELDYLGIHFYLEKLA